ncbi:MAG: peptidase S41, partial [Planctomycetaceae bacterium]
MTRISPQTSINPRAHMFGKRPSVLSGTLLLSVVLFTQSVPQWLTPARAAEDPDRLWIRYPSIAPNGKQIAFSFRGDLWTVSRDGGSARPLSSHLGYESMPVWSPDSKQIAFASDRHGNLDVFVMDAAGGPSRRLTFHSTDDRPTAFTPDGARVLFVSRRQDAPQATIPHPVMSELYSVSTQADRPRQLITTPAERARFSPNGKQLIYQDFKGFEDYWRKHHSSSVTRDIWLWNPKSGKHRKLTQFSGEDRDPVWAPDGKTVYYLSEASGSFNVWKLNPQKPKQAPVQVTQHKPHPVRFLSISDARVLAYGYNGELWTKAIDADPTQVKFSVVAVSLKNQVEQVTLREGATEFAVAANEAEIAVIVRGELFVSSVQHSTT